MAVLAFLLSFLNLGQINSELKLLRGESITPKDALSRAGLWLKAMGQLLWEALWIFLWSLPGMAVTFAGYLLVFRNPGISNFLVSLGSLCTSVLAVRAALRYSMGPVILADRPDTGVLRAQRESISMMKSRTLLLLIVIMSFLLLEFLVTLVTAYLPGMLGATLGMAADLALSVYISTTVCAFYEACREKPAVQFAREGSGPLWMPAESVIPEEIGPESGDGEEPEETGGNDWTETEEPDGSEPEEQDRPEPEGEDRPE